MSEPCVMALDVLVVFALVRWISPRQGVCRERYLPSRRVEHVRKHKQRNASLENARVNLTARRAHLV